MCIIWRHEKRWLVVVGECFAWHVWVLSVDLKCWEMSRITFFLKSIFYYFYLWVFWVYEETRLLPQIPTIFSVALTQNFAFLPQKLMVSHSQGFCSLCPVFVVFCQRSYWPCELSGDDADSCSKWSSLLKGTFYRQQQSARVSEQREECAKQTIVSDWADGEHKAKKHEIQIPLSPQQANCFVAGFVEHLHRVWRYPNESRIMQNGPYTRGKRLSSPGKNVIKCKWLC